MKFRLTDETKTAFGTTLYRIQAIKAFSGVKANDLGGWVEAEHNLSDTGISWIYDEAMVYGSASIQDDAMVRGSARVYGRAVVGARAVVADMAEVCGAAEVWGEAYVHGNIWVGYKAYIAGDMDVSGSGMIKA